ncbi:MAG: NADH-quinone oxidoreductase subunit NuoH [Nitrososphaerota archaeon]|nr:NADH-quinone oxidoreductase subunit NuoH [Nitrososphaerota archaeon]MDG7023981.1 NADH-quinone oxidoreductase subunit NuoH [Nitrososphaerota archaeon]
MSKPITTFEGFIRRILTILFFVALLMIIAIVPIYYLLDEAFHFPVDYLRLAINPNLALAYTQTMLSTEPYKTLFALAVFPGFSFVAVYGTIFMGWVERKFTAKIQLRTGPMNAGKVEGILQNIADFFKLAFKELVIPEGVDRATFLAVPVALMAVAGALISLVPLSPTTYIANPSVGAVLVFAILGFTPLIVLLAGWASNSKYPFLGGLRALHQLVAYEIPMILSLVGAVVLAGSLNLMDIVNAQAGIWYIVPEFLAAIVFYIGALAELERIPFDLPEADSELVAGWQTEYTSMPFGVFQLANFSRMYIMAGLFTTFFLGGWLGPGPVPPEVWFIVKTTIVMIMLMLPRSIMPRLRIDMLLRAGWVKLLAISFANIFLTMVIVSLGLIH